jgi:hypothetical protein
LNIFEPFGIISKICKKTDFFSYTGEGKVHNWTGKMRSKNGIDIMMKSAEPKKISNIQIGNKYELYEIQEVAKENYEEAKSRVLAKRNDEDDGVEEIFDRAHSCP